MDPVFTETSNGLLSGIYTHVFVYISWFLFIFKYVLISEGEGEKHQ